MITWTLTLSHLFGWAGNSSSKWNLVNQSGLAESIALFSQRSVFESRNKWEDLECWFSKHADSLHLLLLAITLFKTPTNTPTTPPFLTCRPCAKLWRFLTHVHKIWTVLLRNFSSGLFSFFLFFSKIFEGLK